MFENKKIFILGMARSGYEAARVLSKRNNTIVLNDMNDKQDPQRVKELEDMGVKVVLGSHPDDLLDESFDYLIKNPGIKFDHKYLKYCGEHNIKVINEIEMAYHILPKGVKIIGITGTNGKTTTTTLIYEMLKKYYKERVHLAGNIGYPLCQIYDDIHENDIIVMEIGVPQLHDFYDFNADIAVLTNIYEAHLDMFGTREYYNETKKRIFMNHTKDNVAIINKGNLDAYNLTLDINSNKKYFSSSEVIDGCFIKDNAIYYYDEKIIDTSDIKIKGVHNYENAMAAIMVCKEMKVPNDIMISVLREFGGVEHRIEFVRTYKGVTYYNDSKATNIKSTQVALSAFKEPTILIAGGYERGHSFKGLDGYLDNTKLVIVYGECKDRIYDELISMNMNTIKVNNLKEAVEVAYKNSENGDVVLLSPASASWDQYKCFEDRGDEFKKLVNELS